MLGREERRNRAGGPRGCHEAGDGADDRHQEPLEHHLAHETRAIGAKRRFDCELRAPRNAARQQQRPGIYAGADQQERRGAQQRGPE